MRTPVMLGIAVLGMLAGTSLRAVELKDRQGNTADVQVLSADRVSTVVLLNGARQTIKLDALAPESAEAVVAAAKGKGTYRTFPPLRVQVTVGTSRRPQGPSGYMKAMTISPSVLIEGRSRMDAIPEIEGTMVIICMDMRSKFVTRGESYEVSLVDSKKMPAARDGAPRRIEFETLETTYDSDRDASNLGGNVYKYYAFILTDPETGSVEHFATNWPDLEKMAQADGEVPRKVMRLRKGVKMSGKPEL